MSSAGRWVCLAAVVVADSVSARAHSDVTDESTRIGDAVAEAFPSPFYRPLEAPFAPNPPLRGEDVYILRGLLQRSAAARGVVGACEVGGPHAEGISTCPFTIETGTALAKFQQSVALPDTGKLDAATASAILDKLGPDGYMWNKTAPSDLGNRSIEPTCALRGGDGSVLFQFQARLHGAVSSPAPPWPNFNNSGSGLNEFSGDGATPTGLSELDLNSPEDDPASFGPYPVNRVVMGVEGNAKLLITGTAGAPRNGILVHTGNWTCCGWTGPPAPMPNSLGCIHAYPESIKTIWTILTTRLGVKVRPNTDGKVPYPYKSQGLISVELVS